MVKKIFIMLVISGTLHGMNPGIQNIAKANDFVMPAHFTPAMQVAVKNAINIGRDHILKMVNVKEREVIKRVLLPKRVKALEDEKTLLMIELTSFLSKNNRTQIWQKSVQDLTDTIDAIRKDVIENNIKLGYYAAKTSQEKLYEAEIRELFDTHFEAQKKSLPPLTVLFCDKDNDDALSTDIASVAVYAKALLKDTENAYEQGAFFLHELFHYTFVDSFETIVLNYVKHTLEVSLQNQLTTLQLRIRHFQEKRADIMAGLIDKQYALALAHYFERMAKKGQILKLPDAVRAQYMMQLYQEMLATIAQHS